MFDVIIIGCGVIGAATAYALAKTKNKVLILEAENDVASKTTKANSAILHAGFDPKPGTLMAKLNVRGLKLAKMICEDLDVPYRQCGSHILARDEKEVETLRRLLKQGEKNGVPDLKIISGEQLRTKEPHVSKKAVASLWAPGAAIVSPWEFALAMAECAVLSGVKLKRNAKVENLERDGKWWNVCTEKERFSARFVINASGLNTADIHNMVAKPTFCINPTRGQYYLLDKNEGMRVKSVIFSCPLETGKGVLVAPTVHGNCIVGPNAESVDGDDSSTTAEGLRYVAEEARKIVPQIDLRSTIRNFSGVRARSNRKDFIIEFAAPGFLDLAGITSPGLTAAPAIGEEVIKRLQENGLALEENPDFVSYRRRIRFKSLSPDEKNALICKTPTYGRVVCRCETITEGEILASLKAPIPPISIDGVKRRCNAGMGRCQGGFCTPRIVEILSREIGVSATEIVQERTGSYVLIDRRKQEMR